MSFKELFLFLKNEKALFVEEKERKFEKERERRKIASGSVC
jgi:hypothetical protein